MWDSVPALNVAWTSRTAMLVLATAIRSAVRLLRSRSAIRSSDARRTRRSALSDWRSWGPAPARPVGRRLTTVHRTPSTATRRALRGLSWPAIGEFGLSELGPGHWPTPNTSSGGPTRTRTSSVPPCADPIDDTARCGELITGPGRLAILVRRGCVRPADACGSWASPTDWSLRLGIWSAWSFATAASAPTAACDPRGFTLIT
jgi:hypothetical protein